MRITKCLVFFLVSASILAVQPGTAQDPMLEYMFYKVPMPLTLDTQSIAAISAPGAPVARGVEEFPSEPLTDELSLVDISASPSSGDPGRDDIYGWGVVNAGGSVEMAPTLVFVCDFESGDLSCWSEVVN